MVKTVTFSVGTKYEGSSETETFTFEKLGIDEDMNDTEVKKGIDEIFQAWVWDKLNISEYSYFGEKRTKYR